jgi:hypothetical protein
MHIMKLKHVPRISNEQAMIETVIKQQSYLRGI